MKMITVRCSKENRDDDVEPRLAVTIAANEADAEALCRRAYRGEAFTDFEAAEIAQDHAAGPARVLGYTGQRPPFSWSA